MVGTTSLCSGYRFNFVIVLNSIEKFGNGFNCLFGRVIGSATAKQGDPGSIPRWGIILLKCIILDLDGTDGAVAGQPAAVGCVTCTGFDSRTVQFFV